MTRKEIIDMKDFLSDPVRMERMKNRNSYTASQVVEDLSRLKRYETSGTLADMAPVASDLSELGKKWRASFDTLQVEWRQGVAERYKQKQEALSRSSLSAIRILRRKGEIKGRLTPEKVQKAGLSIAIFFQTEPTHQHVAKRTRQGNYVKFFKNLKGYEI